MPNAQRPTFVLEKMTSEERKMHPLTRGVLDYFPDALAAVSHVSYVGNQQHNPGEPMHWAREKSPDHADCLVRHLVARGTLDSDGLAHTAKVAWRALALLQTEIDAGGSKANGIGPGAIMWEYEAPVLSVLSNTKSLYAPTFYIAGPMRGLPYLNFPAFDEARDRGIRAGFNIASPADLDRQAGLTPDIDGTTAPLSAEENKAIVQRDVQAIMALEPTRGDGLAVLTGWQHSTGAKAEVALAKWLGLKIVSAVDFVTEVKV